MKIVKYLLIAVAVVVIVFIAGAVVLVVTVDPNDHKDKIVAAVKQATGRDLTLAGDIGFSFFPRLGVKLGEAELSNATGFGRKPFASIEHVGVSVDLLSLLRAKIQADTIELQGLRVNLEKSKNGKTNWDDLTEGSDTSDPSSPSEQPGLGLEVAGIRISDSQVVYDDRQAGNKITLSPIELRTGSIGSGKPSTISAELGMAQTNPNMTADIKLDSKARLNIETMVYQLSDLILAVDAKGEDLPNGEVELKVATNLDADLKRESLKLAPVSIEVAGLKVEGDLSVLSFSKPKISFALHSDEIDLDTVLPTAESTAESEQAPAAADGADDKIELPTDTLRSLNIDGSLNVSTLRATGLTMTDVSATILGKGGVINLNPLTMNLYKGNYTGSAGINVSGATPKYTASSDLRDLAIEGLLADLSEKGKSVIRGKSELSFKVTTSGDRVSTLKKRLNGNASFKAEKGALQSEKLARNVEKVVAFLKGREPKPAGEELVFDSFAGTAVIKDGVANNNDLKLITPIIFADGKGAVDIGKSALDYVLAVGLSEEPGKAAIPITIKGSFEDPKFGIDFQAALKGKQKEIVEEKKQELKEKIDEEIGDKVGDKLKKLKLF